MSEAPLLTNYIIPKVVVIRGVVRNRLVDLVLELNRAGDL